MNACAPQPFSQRPKGGRAVVSTCLLLDLRTRLWFINYERNGKTAQKLYVSLLDRAPCWRHVARGLRHHASPLRPACFRLADLRAGVRFGRPGAAAACARRSGSVGPAASAPHLSAATGRRTGRQARASLADGDGLFVQPTDARAHAPAHLVHAALWVRPPPAEPGVLRVFLRHRHHCRTPSPHPPTCTGRAGRCCCSPSRMPTSRSWAPASCSACR